MSNAVIGTDGKYPIQENEVLWRTWNWYQLWFGAEGESRYVPKVNDWVVKPETQEFFIVDHIDPDTLIPTLRAFSFGNNGVFSDIDRFIGTGPGRPSEIFRVYLNDTVFPHVLSVDAACFIRGSLATHAKIFLGDDTSEETGKVISKVYDSTGNFVSTSVMLELAEIESHTNYSTKIVPRCHCTESYPNDELVTLVIYADDGHVVYRRQLLIQNTDTISDLNAAVRYITHISLESIWLAPGSEDEIQYPLNLPVNSLNMMGVVHYSDGTTSRYPVDGGKFTMLGLGNHVSSMIGQVKPLVLRYLLGNDEIAYAAGGSNNRYITKPFQMVTTNPNYSLGVKLFPYPEWQGDSLGYRIRWFLMNAERNVFFEVTNAVKFNEATGPFDPKLYGYLQRKSVSINLRDVSLAFPSFNHPQVVDIVLNQAPSADTLPSWSVRSEAGESYPYYGVSTYAKLRPGNKINLSSEMATQEDWLEVFYRAALPLTLRGQEVKAPAPTHFGVLYNGVETVYPIESWDQDLGMGAATAAVGKLVVIRFMRRLPDVELQLAYGGAIIKSF